jgi:anti-sigma factor RsiW
MNDCTNLDIRDLLPDLARGALSGPSLATVEEHLATCASCRAELRLLRNALAALGGAPSVDAGRIAAAVVRSRAARQIPRGRIWLAAASVAAITGAAALATSLARKPGGPELAPPIAQVEQPVVETPILPSPEPVRSATRQDTRAELVLGGGLNDLADADLESLLRVLEGLDAQVDVEPVPLLPLLEGEV